MARPNFQNDEAHIERTVRSKFVKTERVLYSYRSWNDVLFIINCDKNFAKELSNKEDVHTMELSEYMSKRRSEIPRDVLILSTTNKCTPFKFEAICEVTKTSNVYLLQQFDKEHCILILSKGEKLEYADATKAFIKETDIFKTFNNPLHVFCAPSGMGKTTLLEVLLDKHCPPECQVIYIALREYNKFDFGNVIEKRSERRGPKTYLFLDGLDELKSEFTDDFLKFVKFVSSKGVNVWLASRENLRGLICEKLYTVPIEIVELNKGEQEDYIKRKLEKCYTNEEIGKIKDTVFTSAELKDDENLLGNPFQLKILTDIFLKDESKETLEDVKNNNLLNLTVLTKLYEIFFQGKIKTAQEKDLGKDQDRLLKPLDDVLQDYELPALQACFSKEDCNKLSLNFGVKEMKDFINKFKKDDDEIGIICRIDKNDEAMFTHQAYAEYFAARWLKRHPEKIPLLRDEIFSGKHQHLRMIFDLMLAEKNPLHLAVIYKDIEQVEEHIQDIDRKDDGGRTIFHLAFSYGEKHPLLDDPEKYIKQLENQKRETPWYLTILAKLFENNQKIPKQKDKLFNFDCARYALQSQCWSAIDWMLKLKIISFKRLKTLIKKHYNYNLESLAICAARFGYSSLFKSLIKHYPKLRKELKFNENLLLLAIKGYDDGVCTFQRERNVEAVNYGLQLKDSTILEDMCTVPRKGNVEAVNILVKSGLKLKRLPALEYACKEKRFDMLEILINNKATCSGGNTMLHFLVQNCPEIYREEILTAIKKFNIDVNARNDDGATALHKAAESADLKIVEMLMEIGADFRILDNVGRSPWHYALSRSRQDITELFLARELISVKDQNQDGTTPLHFASKEGKTDIMKILLERGARPEVTDNAMNNALHYAVNSTCVIPDAIRLLIKSGVDPNARNQDGFAPIHLAYNKCDFRTADLLLKNGAEDEINAKFKDGKTLLHLACNEHRREDVIRLLERGADPNSVDDDNRNALHCYFLEFYAEDVIHAMINHGIDLNTQYEKGDTLLHIVCSQGDTHTMTKLIERKVDLNMTNDKNQTALHAFFQTLQHTEVRVRDRLINRHKYGIDIQHEHDPNTLHFGCEGCYYSFMKHSALIEDDHYKHNRLFTLIGDRELTDVLLKCAPSGVIMGKNVLLTARIIIFKMIHSLIKHGVEITKVDKFQKTALDYVSNLKEQYPEIMKLIRKGASSINKSARESEDVKSLIAPRTSPSEIFDSTLFDKDVLNLKTFLSATKSSDVDDTFVFTN